MFDTEDVGVFLGLDVAKTTHHGNGLTPAGKKVFDKQLPNSAPKLRAVFDKPTAKFGTILVIVGQPASIGALPLTVARDAGCKVAYLPGLAMRQIADLYPGEAKTDAKDAAVIADAARTLPHALRSLEPDEITAELTVLVGFDQDSPPRPPHQQPHTRPAHPVPPRPRTRPGPPSRPPGRHLAAGTLRIPSRAAESRQPQARRGHPTQGPRMAARLTDEVFDALDEQTVVVPGTGTLDVVIPSLARSLGAVHEQRRALEAQIEALLEAYPPSVVLTSMPVVAVRAAAVLLVTVGDGTSFPNAARLASYAGLVHTTKSSGTSIHGERAPRGGNRQLKRAMFLSAFAALHDPASRTYYDKCRARGKTHTQALLRLARHRISVLFAMLCDGTFYEPRVPRALATGSSTHISLLCRPPTPRPPRHPDGQLLPGPGRAARRPLRRPAHRPAPRARHAPRSAASQPGGRQPRQPRER
ncbi:insertion element IS110 uncharacterized 43.6 kDa protein [Streptomyces nojiriensis]|uniref:Insertion element IS110 uncharacterized 43.6 kDa protein n=1 Tax=Streptomyces nojiriensis TaxID=66374 RepID=A0ABQ3SKB4_9ACTN|nr:hypothetical protein JYK04_08054 [Streptomyces nojiriensis]GGS23356.1 insertion element IS110 uncharacterized 43.6 kDa protein [Streptomyces nojiriensis]GHI68583.1 insertion element IS110 uncharacterized 43.6 kDa protein [Streptomyces nojiriensis]